MKLTHMILSTVFKKANEAHFGPSYIFWGLVCNLIAWLIKTDKRKSDCIYRFFTASQMGKFVNCDKM